MNKKIGTGIIAGTGFYDTDIITDKEFLEINTPYGKTSEKLMIGNINGKNVVFLPRHGKEHNVPPHKINFRANLWAMKEIGVERILAPCAVGSLQEEMEPGHIVVPDQFIDRTKNRPSTFYEDGKVAHISTADPFCPELRNVIVDSGRDIEMKIHSKGTQVCIEGPRFSTRAESNMFRIWKADTINMTLLPECILARELEICYVAIATITDYDVWAEKPVTHKEVIKTLNENVDKINNLLINSIPKIPEKRNCVCKNALSEATNS